MRHSIKSASGTWYTGRPAVMLQDKNQAKALVSAWPTSVLVDAALGDLNLNQLAYEALAARGLNRYGLAANPGMAKAA